MLEAGMVFFGPLAVLIVLAGEENPDGFPPTLGVFCFPP